MSSAPASLPSLLHAVATTTTDLEAAIHRVLEHAKTPGDLAWAIRSTSAAIDRYGVSATDAEHAGARATDDAERAAQLQQLHTANRCRGRLEQLLERLDERGEQLRELEEAKAAEQEASGDRETVYFVRPESPRRVGGGR